MLLSLAMVTPEISRPEKRRGFPSPKKETLLYRDFISLYAERIIDYAHARLPDWRPTHLCPSRGEYLQGDSLKVLVVVNPQKVQDAHELPFPSNRSGKFN